MSSKNNSIVDEFKNYILSPPDIETVPLNFRSQVSASDIPPEQLESIFLFFNAKIFRINFVVDFTDDLIGEFKFNKEKLKHIKFALNADHRASMTFDISGQNIHRKLFFFKGLNANVHIFDLTLENVIIDYLEDHRDLVIKASSISKITLQFKS